MSEFIKSALNYFNSESSSALKNEFIGQVVEVGQLKLRIKSLIAEGGFAFVYEAQDINQGNLYALKRLFGADKEACNNIIQELNIHKQVSNHPNIVKFITASLVDRTKSANGLAEYLLVTELCTGGALIDYMNETIDAETVLKIFYQASQAIKHLHFQTPPIVHRDIKIENFLLGADGLIKLCDFGSATTEIIQPDPSWNANTRNTLEEKLATFTTPMYRAPEQLDTWENRLIGPKSDIWALGCILYVLCFQRHPFEDSAKLRIINGNYTMPSNSAYSCFHAIIKGCLQTNPDNRFDISTVLERLAAISESLNFNLKGPIKLKPALPKPSAQLEHEEENRSPKLPNRPAPERPEPPRNPQRPPPPQTQPPPPAYQPQQYPAGNVGGTANSSNGLFASIRGGAGSFLKNLKDTSSKVMQTVQQTMTKGDMDMSYITSRILVMPCPPEGLEAAYRANHLEYIKGFLESKHRLANISVYNFGPRSTARLPPPVRTVEGSGIYYPAPPRAPSLRGLYSIVEDMYGFLCADLKNVVIVQSADMGKSVAATIVAALMIYGSLIIEPEDGIQMFAVKRIPPNMRPSELRYLYYMTDVVRSKPYFPHFKPLTLQCLTISPVPRMTKARDGCRFFIEILCNEKQVLSTLDDYERMRLYHASEGKITINFNNICVSGDLCVAMYHARNSLGGIGGRPHGIKVCQFQLNTGYIPEQENLLSFDRQELDEITECDQFLTNLNVQMSIMVGNEERPPTTTLPWMNGKNVNRNPLFLFDSDLEMQENVENFITVQKSKATDHEVNKPPRPAPVRPPAPPSPVPPPARPTMVQPDLVQHTEEADRIATESLSQDFDLLNLNQSSRNETFQPQVQPSRPPPPSKGLSFDLLGFSQPDKPSDPIPIPTAQNTTSNIDLLGGSTFPHSPSSSSTNPTDSAFNLLGNLNLNLNSEPPKPVPTATPTSFDPFSNLLQPNKKSAGASENQTQQQKPEPSNNLDPFADLGLGSFVTNMTKSTPTSSPNSQSQSASTMLPPQPSPATSNNTTPTHQSRPPPQQEQKKPDYSRSHFDATKGNASKNNNGAASGGAAKPAGGFGDIFADILGEQGYSFGSKIQGPRTINDMRKEDIVKEMDPERFKIMEWTEGKTGNIRALLCSMHTVLWENAKWTKCEMHQLVSFADVRKAYRKACLAAHPDKHTGTENETISKMIFVELNNAWSDFEEDEKQQNLF